MARGVKSSRIFQSSGRCGNLYGCCVERCINLSQSEGRFSFIVPVAITCSKRMDVVLKLLKNKAKLLLFANFDDRPGKLFEMIEHLRATIFIVDKSKEIELQTIFATKYNRWYTQCRNYLFDNLCYANVIEFVCSYVIPKLSYSIECNINRKIYSTKNVLAKAYASSNVNNKVYYRAAGGGYFLLIKDKKSITYINGVLEDVKAEKEISISTVYSNSAIGALLSSNLFYWNYIGYTDCRNLTKSFIDDFHVELTLCLDDEIIKCGKLLFADYENNKYRKDTYYKSTGRNVIYDEYYPKKSKILIDEIDKALAKHYGFTEEELDFIINYDIKYRMGDELNE